MLEAQALLSRLLSLTEAGRVLSKNSLTAIRAALDALNALVGQAEGAQGEPAAADGAHAKARESAVKLTEDAIALLEAEFSANDKQTILRAALKALNPASKRWYWVRDLFDSWFVYEDDGPDGMGASRLFKRTYVIGDDGKVTLGDPVEVRQKTVYETVGAPAVSESADLEVAGDFIPLVEKAVRRDSTVPVKLIQPGWGTSGYYGAEMLERDGPKVFTKGTKMYWDHPTAAEEAARPERSLRDLAAELVGDARWEPKGAAGPGLYADAKVFRGFRESVDELAPHIGVSIRAMGKGKPGEVEGRKGPVIESIVAAKSVDFVTAPGAGGQVLSLFESARGRATTTTPEENQVTEAEAQALREANTASVARISTLEERLLRADASEFVREQLATLSEAARLPEPARARLTTALVAEPPVKDGELDREAFTARIKEAAAAELAYISSLGGSGHVRGMGSAAPVEVSEADTDASLKETFQRLGLSEASAAIAAGGRS